jgi:hypothetical protein
MGTASVKQCKYGPMIDLREMEEEVLVEGREWMRRRMEDKLREKAAAFSPRGEADSSERPVPKVDD